MSTVTARDLVLSPCERRPPETTAHHTCAVMPSYLARHYLHGSEAWLKFRCKRSLVLTGSAVREPKPCAASGRSSLEKKGPRRQDDRRIQLLKRAESFDGRNFQDMKLRVDTNMQAVRHPCGDPDIASGEITEQAVKEATRKRYSTRFCSSS